MRAAAMDIAGLVCAPDTGRKMVVREMMARPATIPQYAWPELWCRSGVLDAVWCMQQTSNTYRNVEIHSAVRARQKESVLQN